MAFGGGGSSVTKGVNESFLICSRADRRVEGVENPWLVVIKMNAMQQGSSRLTWKGVIMVGII